MKFSTVTCLAVFSVVYGCGQLPQNQVVAIRFTVTSTVLPVEMAYTETNVVRALISTINSNQQMAKTVVERLVKGTVEDVLVEQGRSAFLPYPVITQILQQLTINIIYEPIKCVVASKTLAKINGFMTNMPEGCFIIDGFVTLLCKEMACDYPAMPTHVKPVPSAYMTFSGSLATSNVVMANWSRQMWESVLNRVHRKLASARTPLGTFFSRATVTLN